MGKEDFKEHKPKPNLFSIDNANETRISIDYGVDTRTKWGTTMTDLIVVLTVIIVVIGLVIAWATANIAKNNQKHEIAWLSSNLSAVLRSVAHIMEAKTNIAHDNPHSGVFIYESEGRLFSFNRLPDKFIGFDIDSKRVSLEAFLKAAGALQ